MTKAEIALIDAALSQALPQDATWEKLVGAVLSERMAPELLKRAIEVTKRYEEACAEHGALWSELNALGFVGKRAEGLFDELRAAARAR